MRGGVFLNNLKRLRQEMQMSQKDLSDKIGISQQAVAKWEAGEAAPRADKLPKIAEVLRCPVDALFDK